MKYLIMDSRSVVGNCALWWRPEGKGYTGEFSEAGVFDYKSAHAHRETDIPVPFELAEAVAVRHVRVDMLREFIDLDPGKKSVEERTIGRGQPPISQDSLIGFSDQVALWIKKDHSGSSPAEREWIRDELCGKSELEAKSMVDWIADQICAAARRERTL